MTKTKIPVCKDIPELFTQINTPESKIKKISNMPLGKRHILMQNIAKKRQECKKKK